MLFHRKFTVFSIKSSCTVLDLKGKLVQSFQFTDGQIEIKWPEAEIKAFSFKIVVGIQNKG